MAHSLSKPDPSGEPRPVHPLDPCPYPLPGRHFSSPPLIPEARIARPTSVDRRLGRHQPLDFRAAATITGLWRTATQHAANKSSCHPSILSMSSTLALSGRTIADNDRIAADVAAQGPRLRAFVRRQVADVAEVEDIVQDSFAQLVAAYRLLEPIQHVAAWLQRVARNRIIDRFRRRAHEAPWTDGAGRNEAASIDDGASEAAELWETWPAPTALSPEASYVREVLVDELGAALAELPEEQRAVFIAHELEGRSFKALAAEKGVSINTLLGRKHAAVRHLRQRLHDIRSELDV